MLRGRRVNERLEGLVSGLAGKKGMAEAERGVLKEGGLKVLSGGSEVLVNEGNSILAKSGY